MAAAARGRGSLRTRSSRPGGRADRRDPLRAQAKGAKGGAGGAGKKKKDGLAGPGGAEGPAAKGANRAAIGRDALEATVRRVCQLRGQIAELGQCEQARRAAAEGPEAAGPADVPMPEAAAEGRRDMTLPFGLLKQLSEEVQNLAQMAKTEANLPALVSHKAIEAVAPLLVLQGAGDDYPKGEDCIDDIIAECCLILGVLSLKVEYADLVSKSGAVKYLVVALKRQASRLSRDFKFGKQCATTVFTARRVADSVTNLAHDSPKNKNGFRKEGGIEPLTQLLKSSDPKLQRSAAAALRALAFKNDENKARIVDSGAVSTLVCLLYSRECTVHNEAVGVIGNLVHSSAEIKSKVLEEGALQPIIKLLHSSSNESRKEAALLLGQFATVTVPDLKSQIVQRGALPPLVSMLSSSDEQLQEMAAFAIGRLAQNTDNQAGLVHFNGLKPLLALLNSRTSSLQHNAAFAIYGIADNHENLVEILGHGVVHSLKKGDFRGQASKDCAMKTMKRLEEKVQLPSVMIRLCHMLTSALPNTKWNIAASLAHLVSHAHLQKFFLHNNGLDTLVSTMLTTGNMEQIQICANALVAVARKSNAMHAAFHSTGTSSEAPVYLGAKYINNPEKSDVVFHIRDALCEESLGAAEVDPGARRRPYLNDNPGRTFHGHKAAISEMSKVLPRLIQEAEAKGPEAAGGGRVDVVVQDWHGVNFQLATGTSSCEFAWKGFEKMMEFIYTGKVDFASHFDAAAKAKYSTLTPIEVAGMESMRLLPYAVDFQVDALKAWCLANINRWLESKTSNFQTVLSILDLAHATDSTGLYVSCLLRILEDLEYANIEAQVDRIFPRPWLPDGTAPQPFKAVDSGGKVLEGNVVDPSYIHKDGTVVVTEIGMEISLFFADFFDVLRGNLSYLKDHIKVHLEKCH